jgi:hypothetical protein
MPKSYAGEFRRRAVALARSGRPVGQVAVDLKVSEALLAPDKEIRSPKLGERKKAPIRLLGYAERRSDLLVAVCAFMGLSTDDLGRSRSPKVASPAKGHGGSLSPRTAPSRSAPAHLPYVGYCQSQAGGLPPTRATVPEQ